jgi:hypothetical protein
MNPSQAPQLVGRSVNAYFWLIDDQKEIDYIEEHASRLGAYEFKWGASCFCEKTKKSISVKSNTENHSLYKPGNHH